MSEVLRQFERALGRLKNGAAGDGISACDVLALDAPAETQRIANTLRDQIRRHLRRRGAVIGLSGGIDSSVSAALCVKALGPDNVLGLLMPERDSDSDSLILGRMLAEALGIKHVVEDIGETLTAAGCYRRRDEFIHRVVPEFDLGWRCKVVIVNALDGARYNLTMLVVQSPDGEQRKVRMPLDVDLGIVWSRLRQRRSDQALEQYVAHCRNL